LLAALALTHFTAHAAEPLVLPLWPGVAPGSEGVADNERVERRGGTQRRDDWLTGVVKPTLSIYTPAEGLERTGVACVVLPGGGYAGLAVAKEGHAIARWMAEHGVVGAVATYRCGQQAFRHPIPKNDAQRAIRLLRSKAGELGFDADRVGVLGFSAGGHLAATCATQFEPGEPSADDAVARLSSRPDFAVLVYPVIPLTGPGSHRGSADNLLGPNADRQQLEELSADRCVASDTPPVMLVHSIDDPGVSVEGSLRMLAACRERGVPVEAHFYPSGGHGYGMIAGPNWAPALGAYLRSK
jgi:acetyl esterase/lipase